MNKSMAKLFCSSIACIAVVCILLLMFAPSLFAQDDDSDLDGEAGSITYDNDSNGGSTITLGPDDVNWETETLYDYDANPQVIMDPDANGLSSMPRIRFSDTMECIDYGAIGECVSRDTCSSNCETYQSTYTFCMPYQNVPTLARLAGGNNFQGDVIEYGLECICCNAAQPIT